MNFLFFYRKYVELEDSEELVTTRLKLEIPHVYEKDGQFDQEWFTSIKTKQKECLEQVYTLDFSTDSLFSVPAEVQHFI